MGYSNIQVALGAAIKTLRRQQGYSQESFADVVGLHRTYMGGIERGERNVGIRNLSKIALALNLSPSQLLGQAEAAIDGGCTAPKKEQM